MADTSDRPPDPRGLAAPALAPDEAPHSYSSLSLLAVGGLSVAVLYAVVVGGGGAIALFYRLPWVLPLWTLAVPVAAVVLCWAARVQIQNSEGALTGARLAAWGVWLSVVVGLFYGAYYSACYLSITQMAVAVADEWFDDVKNDHIDKAFLLGLPPPRPAANADLRARLEMEFDRGSGGGQYSEFRGSQFVRQIQEGGPAAQVQLLGVKQWGSVPGGYEVQLAYRVSTPYLSSEAVLTVVSVDNADESGGRQWYVKAPQTTSQVLVTAEGRRMIDQMNAARATAQAWLGKVGEWNWDEAYLETLPPPERERERQLRERGPKFDEGWKAFRDGGLVRADPAIFWAGEKDRDVIIAAVKAMFGHAAASLDKISLSPTPPTYQREQDRTRIGFDLMIPMPPRYMVQGRLMVAADGDDPAPTDWRIESLDLISGKSMEASARPAGQRKP